MQDREQIDCGGHQRREHDGGHEQIEQEGQDTVAP
jgi:hypothetical protein